MIRVFTDIDDIKKEWDSVNLKDFIKINFIQAFYKGHKNLKHLFIVDKCLRMYAHIFTLKFSRTNNYLYSRFIPLFLSLFSFRILYLTNTFITNIPLYYSTDIISLRSILKSIKHHYSIIVIPDFVFKNMKDKEGSYKKVEVEEDMVLALQASWINFDDYLKDLRSKYRKKINLIIKQTNNLDIRILNDKDLASYSVLMQSMFEQIIGDTKFKGPLFNIETFSFLGNDLVTVYGYFLDDRLVAFSSEIKHNNTLYSYYTGFNKELNKTTPIYGRILIEHIKNAIKFKNQNSNIIKIYFISNILLVLSSLQSLYHLVLLLLLFR